MSILGIILIGLVVGLIARFVTPGPNPRGIIVTIVIGVVGAVIATYGGQALGLYQVGQTAGFLGSIVGAVVLLILLRLIGR
ncbi:MAG: GlsB/YeaQ/YmgE family stress response membrane protein [Reyranella sp.]|nr:GlsB/YeaQ/YmgE family stress response membrane protein [Reyranella sp.]